MAPTQTQSIPTLASLRQNRAKILATFNKHGCSNVRIFGSVARNEATPDSDIDFMCDHDPSKRTPWFPMGLIEDLETLTGFTVDISFPDLLDRKYVGPSIKQELIQL